MRGAAFPERTDQARPDETRLLAVSRFAPIKLVDLCSPPHVNVLDGLDEISWEDKGTFQYVSSSTDSHCWTDSWTVLFQPRLAYAILAWKHPHRGRSP